MSGTGRKPAPRPRRRPAPAPPTKGALRVVAGDLRGRRLDLPPGEGTRPTSDRVREAVFNALDSLGAVVDARVVDAYAGSGALGIEALSRGAAHVTFAEVDGATREVLAGNVELLGLGGRSVVVGGDGARTVAGGGPWDLVLLDPPYVFARWDDLLALVVGVLAPDGVVVVESDREVALPEGLVGIRSKTYGGTVVQFATPAGAHP